MYPFSLQYSLSFFLNAFNFFPKLRLSVIIALTLIQPYNYECFLLNPKLRWLSYRIHHLLLFQFFRMRAPFHCDYQQEWQFCLFALIVSIRNRFVNIYFLLLQKNNKKFGGANFRWYEHTD